MWSGLFHTGRTLRRFPRQVKAYSATGHVQQGLSTDATRGLSCVKLAPCPFPPGLCHTGRALPRIPSQARVYCVTQMLHVLRRMLTTPGNHLPLVVPLRLRCQATRWRRYSRGFPDGGERPLIGQRDETRVVTWGAPDWRRDLHTRRVAAQDALKTEPTRASSSQNFV